MPDDVSRMEDGPRIVRIAEPLPAIEKTAASISNMAPKLLTFVRKRLLFVLFFILPVFYAFIYYSSIAAPMFVSEATFILRSGVKKQVDPFTALLQNVGVGKAQEETYIVEEFVLSRDMVALLEEQEQLSAAFKHEKADFWQRYPRPFEDENFERLYKAYPRFITFSTDGSTGLSKIKVRAFTAEQSEKIAQAILRNSEEFVNKLNDSARQDSLRDAQVEVEEAEERVSRAQAALTAYRLETQVLDPRSTSTAATELVASLSVEAAGARAQLETLARTAPNSPQIPIIQTQIQSLESQIARERAKITGSGRSLVNQASRFETLFLENRFAEEALRAANTALGVVRLESRQKEVYLQRIAEPKAPDSSTHPRRARSIFVVFLSALLGYGILALIAAGVREHYGR